MTTANKPIGMGAILRYALLPAVLPRVRDLVTTGFGSFAFFVALVYRAVRLLPDGHAFLNPVNIGKFGVVAVITEAFRHIRFNRFQLKQKNLDQIIVFFVVLAALGLLILQFITLAMAVVMPSAMAFTFQGGASFATPFAMFDTPNIRVNGQPESFYDISFIFLDRVFGVPGMFGSCIADGVEGSCKAMGSMYGADPSGTSTVNDPAAFPWPYHVALQGIFQFYSVGLLVVAMFLLVYYTIVVVVETAQTGTPFGKRFNTLWAPLRLVTAAGLLIPISYGLNAGQYLTLYSAKWGANFASNGWIGFNQVLATAAGGTGATPVGDKANLIARPGRPDAMELVHFISVMQACKTIEDTVLQPYMLRLTQDNRDVGSEPSPVIKPYLVRNNVKQSGDPYFLELTDSMTYDDAVKWSNLGDVVIRFGVQDTNIFRTRRGTVEAYCGEITIPTVVVPAGAASSGGGTSTTAMAYQHQGAQTIMRNYWDLLEKLIFKRNNGDGYPATSINAGDINYNGPAAPTLPWNINQKISQPYVDAYMGMKLSTTSTTEDDRRELINYINTTLDQIIAGAQNVEKANSTNPYNMPIDLLARGWAGAGIWYNRIADMNGTFTAAAFNLPKVSQYPQTMVYLATKKQETQNNTSPSEIFAPYVQNTPFAIVFPRMKDEARAANAYWAITQFWQAQETGFSTSSRTVKTGNVILDLINFMFGTSGLFSIRENANVHPLAQLSSIGKSLVERSVTLLGVGLAGTAVQPWIPENLAGLRSALGVISNFAFSVLSIGAAAGFILYYIIPFLPFIYFFFAVSGWVKAIFEAMVGVPLWALAHIRIDGNGLPGDAAASGYFLLLEIMIRPILIVFGLIASVTIYAASVHVLNDIFNLAVANVGGLDMDANMTNQQFTMENLRGSIDTFFYTIMYVILVYMLGMSCFKLIDLIPGSMLRWLGSNANAFTDSGDQAANQLVGYGTVGSNMAFGQLTSAARGATQGISETTKALSEMKK